MFVSFSAGLSITYQSIWVGGDDLSEEGMFKRVNGNLKLVQGIPWASGQPNNAAIVSDCMLLYKHTVKFYIKPCTSWYMVPKFGRLLLTANTH